MRLKRDYSIDGFKDRAIGYKSDYAKKPLLRRGVISKNQTNKQVVYLVFMGEGQGFMWGVDKYG